MATKNIKLKNSNGDYLQPYTENIPTASTTTAGKVKLDNTPVSGSSNALTSGAAHTALAGKLDTTATASKATADASGNNIANTYATKTEVETLRNTAEEAKSIAQGRVKASAYANYEALITALNSAASSDFKIGDNLFIQAQNVPDLWIYAVESSAVPYSYTTDEAFVNAIQNDAFIQIGYYKVSILETAKVDLANYVSSNRTINGKSLVSDVTLSASDVGALAVDGTASKATADENGNNIASTYAKLSDTISYEEMN